MGRSSIKGHGQTKFVSNPTTTEMLNRILRLKLYRIHEKLMSLQLAELEALKEFLTATEDRISQMISPPLDDMDALEENLKEQKRLHDDILKQQQRVVAFSNLVVVVDENNPDNGICPIKCLLFSNFD